MAPPFNIKFMPLYALFAAGKPSMGNILFGFYDLYSFPPAQFPKYCPDLQSLLFIEYFCPPFRSTPQWARMP